MVTNQSVSLKDTKTFSYRTFKCKLSMENYFDSGQTPSVKIIVGLSTLTPLNLSDGVHVCDTWYTDGHDYFFQAAETASVN